MAFAIGQKELKTKWPVVEGQIAGTTKQTGRDLALGASIGSKVPQRTLRGIR